MSKSYEQEVLEDARDFILDRLDEFDYDEPEKTYGSDFHILLFDEAYENHTMTFSAEEAYQYIMSHPRAAASTHDYLKEIETDINPFDDSEMFHIVMIEEPVRTILSECPLISENWNDEFTFDTKAYNTLKEEILKVDLSKIER